MPLKGVDDDHVFCGKCGGVWKRRSLRAQDVQPCLDFRLQSESLSMKMSQVFKQNKTGSVRMYM